MDGLALLAAAVEVAPKVNADGAAPDAVGVVEAGVEVPKVVVVEGPQVTMVSMGGDDDQ